MYILSPLCLCIALIPNLVGSCKLLDHYIEANRKFTIDVYSELSKLRPTGNLLICPVSIAIVLGLVRFGAKGVTADELSLYINKEDSERKKLFSELLSNFKHREGYEFKLANNLFVSEKYEINEEFKTVSERVFETPIQSVDFRKSKSTINHVNTWVKNKTNGKIKDIITNTDIDDKTAAVIVNALYFQANWAKPFRKRTEKSSFDIDSENSVLIDMMSAHHSFKFCEDDKLDAQFLELPFEGNDVSMTIVLPKTKFGLAHLESRISDVLLPRKFIEKVVSVIIPIYQVTSTINLKAALSAMGVNTPFSTAANFSGISGTQPPLFINNLVQKTFLEIDEKGATAVAATRIVATTKRAARYIFLANHPFLYYLKHNQGGIFFVGRFSTPSQ